MHSTLDPAPPPRSTHPVVRLLRGLWTLPTTLVGHGLGLLLCRRWPRHHTSPLASAWVYPLGGRLGRAIGGVTLGHVILLSTTHSNGLYGRLLLAHELAHTRQHDVLGPLYLPAHGLLQAYSALRSLFAPVEGSTPVHAYNPLEEGWISMGHAAMHDLYRGERLGDEALQVWLEGWGV